MNFVKLHIWYREFSSVVYTKLDLKIENFLRKANSPAFYWKERDKEGVDWDFNQAAVFELNAIFIGRSFYNPDNLKAIGSIDD